MSQLRDQSDIAKTVRGLKTGPRNAADTEASICVPGNATFGSSETRSQLEVVEFHVKSDGERICPRRPVPSIIRFAVIPPIDWPLTFPESVSTYACNTSRPARRGSHRGGGTEPFVGGRGRRRSGRSEEHTSELQSRLHLVCRLLLEKKKKRKKIVGNTSIDVAWSTNRV